MGVSAGATIRISDRLRPSARALIWFLTWLVIIGHPLTSSFYWGFMLDTGVLPHDADSIGIPIFADLIGALITAVPMLGLTKLALVFKTGPFRLWSWSGCRPILSTLWSIGLGGPAIYLASLIVRDVVDPKSWYDYVWLPHMAVLIVWLLVLRGAALSRDGAR